MIDRRLAQADWVSLLCYEEMKFIFNLIVFFNY